MISWGGNIGVHITITNSKVFNLVWNVRLQIGVIIKTLSIINQTYLYSRHEVTWSLYL